MTYLTPPTREEYYARVNFCVNLTEKRYVEENRWGRCPFGSHRGTGMDEPQPDLHPAVLRLGDQGAV